MCELAAVVERWVDRLLPDRERAGRLRSDLAEAFGADHRRVDRDAVDEVRAVAQRHSRHLELAFAPSGGLVPDDDPPGWPPVPAQDVARRGAWISRVARRADGTGILAVDNLDPVHLAAPFLEAAFAVLRHATGLVLDLRRNGGGDPATAVLLLSWMLGAQQRHVADVVGRDGTRQWWTTARAPELSVDPEVPVAVLISARTFSSGEALAFLVQSSGRARLVGERTPGAADHITPITLTSNVEGFLPEAYYLDVTRGGNWEGTGVLPDVACAGEDALDVALDLLATSTGRAQTATVATTTAGTTTAGTTPAGGAVRPRGRSGRRRA